MDTGHNTIQVLHGGSRRGITMFHEGRTLHVDHSAVGDEVTVWTMDPECKDGVFTTIIEGYLYLLNGHVAS